jgi:hypothetical protein
VNNLNYYAGLTAQSVFVEVPPAADVRKLFEARKCGVYVAAQGGVDLRHRNADST